MKEIKINRTDEIPDNFTGIAKFASGTKFYLKNGKRHRLNGPAVEHFNGDVSWYKNGKLHRLDGPATIWTNGTQIWCQNGVRHRLDGPAVIKSCHDTEYWICDEHLSYGQFNQKTKLIRKQLSKRNTDYKHLTDEQWYEYLNILHG